MSGIVFTTNTAGGIILNNPATQLPATIAAGVTVTNTTASKGGIGVYGTTGTAWTVTNLGTVATTNTSTGTGIQLEDGGVVANGSVSHTGALISSDYTDVKIVGAFATVANYATMTSTGIGITLGDGGIVTNGPSGSTAALISSTRSGVAITGNSGTIANFGTLENSGTFAAVYIGDGGLVTNGSTSAAGALIKSAKTGVAAKNQFATITNFATIVSTATGTSGVGVYLNDGGVITNAAGALITAYRTAVSEAAGAPATLTNNGTLSSTGTSVPAVYFGDGGTITNGATASSALISGKGGGVAVKTGFADINNFATIQVLAGATQAAAIYVNDGGVITNGSTTATNALIVSALTGIAAKLQYTTINNFATIEGNGTSGSAIYMNSGGVISNAASGVISGNAHAIEVLQIGTSLNATTLTNAGLIENTGTHDAVYFADVVSVTNTGTITTTNTKSAIDAMTFGTITNDKLISAPDGVGVGIGKSGTATQAAMVIQNNATITGAIGVGISSDDTGFNTIVNNGTIDGTGGTAVLMGSGGDDVVLEENSKLIGAIGNFHPGDKIDLPWLPFTGQGTVSLVGNTLTIAEDGLTYNVGLDPSFNGGFYQLESDGTGGTQVAESNGYYEMVQYASSGQVDYLSLSNGNLIGTDTLSQTLWNVVANGDFTGQGQDDLVTQGPTGQLDFVFMNGLTIAGSALTSGSFLPVHGQGNFGTVAGVDGPAVIAQAPSSGAIDLLWFTANGTLAASEALNGSYWSVVGAGNFTGGTGNDEIVTQNSSGQIDLLSFTGANLTGSTLLNGNYEPVATVDYVTHTTTANITTQNPTTGAIDHLFFTGPNLTGSLSESTPFFAGSAIVDGTSLLNKG